MWKHWNANVNAWDSWLFQGWFTHTGTTVHYVWLQICAWFYFISHGLKGWTVHWELWECDRCSGGHAGDMCESLCVWVWGGVGGGGRMKASESRLARMCPVGGGWFLLYACLSVRVHKQMGADILTSTGNTLSSSSTGIWHQQATGKPASSLSGQRDANEACR